MPETVLDAAQRLQALDPTDSFIVQAPAGSVASGSGPRPEITVPETDSLAKAPDA